MDSERQGRLVTVTCQTVALVVALALIAGQYHAMLTAGDPPTLPVTGSQTTANTKLGLVERLRLRSTVQERYNRLSQLEELTPEQQEQLEAIAALLGD